MGGGGGCPLLFGGGGGGEGGVDGGFGEGPLEVSSTLLSKNLCF